jgi:hypothetical protein
MEETGDGVGDERQLHFEGVDPPVGGEVPTSFETVKQVVVGGGHPALFGGGIGTDEFGGAEGLLFEDGVLKQGKVGLLVEDEEEHRGVDGDFGTVVLWHQAKPPSVVGYVPVPHYPMRFRFFNHPGGYAADRNKNRRSDPKLL